MILIFEQEEFKYSKTFAATIIPNLIRFSVVIILFFPFLLGMSNQGVDNLKGLAILVYIPFIFTLITFKDKGERNARYSQEDKGVKNIVDEIINQQKFNTAFWINEDGNEFINKQFGYLKGELKRKLKRFDFELINFYFAFDSLPLEGTEFDEDEKINGRAITIKRILGKMKTEGLANLLEVASQKRLNCVSIYKAAIKPEEDLNVEDSIVIDISLETTIIIDNIQSLGIPLSKEDKERIEDNIEMHKKASEKERKDYFVYIIRPIEDIEGIVTYLVLLRPSCLGKETLSSFQTLIDLTLLRYNKVRLKIMEEEIDTLVKNTGKFASEKLRLENIIDQLEINLGKKQERDNNIKRWKNFVSNNMLKELFEESIVYTDQVNLLDINNLFRELKAKWMQHNLDKDRNIITYNDFDLKLSQVRSALLNTLDNLANT